MIVGIGIDIAEVGRVKSALRDTPGMEERVFTSQESRFCRRHRNQYQHFSARFAAKEAAMKALGTGWSQGITWTDVEVTNDDSGKPLLHLHGQARVVSLELGAQRAWLSISHCAEHAVAVVVLEK